MKRLTLIISLLIAIAAPLKAVTIEQLFLDEHAGVFNLLDRQARMIMLDNFKSGAKVPVSNNMEGDSSRIVALSEREITVLTSPARQVQARLLVNKRDSIIIAVETVSTPYRDSRVTFYTTAWRRVPEADHIKPVPAITMLYRSAMDANAQAELDALAMPMMEMTLEDDRLALRHSYKPQVTKEVYTKLEPKLFDVRYYQIDGLKLKLIK